MFRSDDPAEETAMDVALEDRPRLEDLLARVERGEAVTLTRSGEVVAELAPRRRAATRAVDPDDLLSRFQALRDQAPVEDEEFRELLARPDRL